MGRVNILILAISIMSFILFPFILIQTLSIFVIITYLLAYIFSRLLFINLKVALDKDIYYCNNSEDEHVGFKVINTGFLPLDHILIQIRGNGCFDNGESLFMDSIGPRGCIKLKSKIITNVRGSHKVGPIILKGADPFNFFPWTKQIDIYSEVVIYPRYHDIKLLLNNGERGGHQRVKNPLYEDLSDLKSIREFRPGDSLKRVNWKATAKVGKLQTMEFSNSLSAPLFVLMDLDPRKYPIKHRYSHLERAIELTASLVTSYSEKKEGCGILTRDKSGTILIPLDRGYVHAISILDNLAKIDFSNLEDNEDNIIKSFFNNRTVLPPGSHIYILLPEIDDVIISDMNLFKKGKYNIKLVNTGGRNTEYTPFSYELLTLSNYGEEFFI